MNSTFFTRCLRTTPSSLVRRQQMPSRCLQRTTALAYSTAPDPQNSEPEKQQQQQQQQPPTENGKPSESSNETTSPVTEPMTTTTTTAASRAETSRRLLDSLQFPPPRPTTWSSTAESDLAETMRGLRGKMKALNERPNEEALAREFIRPDRSRNDDNNQQQQAASLNALAQRIPRLQDRRPKPTLKTVPMKLGPKLGRQVMVQNDKGMDCASAIRALEMTCRMNSLRRQEASQRFHVRRGQARKNIRIQRWRKLFKFSFLETVKKIDRMRDQGW